VIAAMLVGCASIDAQPGGCCVVTTDPVRVSPGSLGLCVAVDPQDAHGVWWWEPGPAGCATRSTGPDVFRADDATVSAQRRGVTAVEFRLETHSATQPSFVRVRLMLEGTTLRSLDTDSQVALEPRDGHAIPQEAPRAEAPSQVGLDHIPVAVRDLEAATATYRALGFALKPGRPHPNGIRNAHVKFLDGAGLELLTVSAAVDPLSAKYAAMIRDGEGPAFLSFHDRDMASLHAALRRGGYTYRDADGLTDLRIRDLDYLFWIGDNRSPSDRPEHFAHPNGATALGAVWIATENGDALTRLLITLGGRLERRRVFAPEAVDATVVTLAEGEVLILPARCQLLPGRPVIGASFRAGDLSAVKRTLASAGITPWKASRPDMTDRVVVEPAHAHGLWLEFRRSE
jgi:catechol 2,3-dioxygenase-like lactoylglutathione lyase family enzyme